jgi:hypothetical protein
MQRFDAVNKQSSLIVTSIKGRGNPGKRGYLGTYILLHNQLCLHRSKAATEEGTVGPLGTSASNSGRFQTF